MYHIIDIGSNSIRLLKVSGEETQSRRLITTALGKNIEKTKRLSAASYLASVSAIKEFSDEAKRDKTQGIFAFATQAVREARNGKLFCEEINSRFGIKIEVLSGEEEAELGFLGAAKNRGREAVVDIGGASCEICYGVEGKIVYKTSVPVGIVKIADSSKREVSDISQYLSRFDKEFLQARNAILCDNNAEKLANNLDITFIGGTSAAATACIMGLEKFDEDEIDGKVITKTELTAFTEKIEKLTTDEIFERYCVSQSRSKTILGGVVLMERLLELFECDKFCSSKSDNLDGFAKKKEILK